MGSISMSCDGLVIHGQSRATAEGLRDRPPQAAGRRCPDPDRGGTVRERHRHYHALALQVGDCRSCLGARRQDHSRDFAGTLASRSWRGDTGCRTKLRAATAPPACLALAAGVSDEARRPADATRCRPTQAVPARAGTASSPTAPTRDRGRSSCRRQVRSDAPCTARAWTVEVPTGRPSETYHSLRWALCQTSVKAAERCCGQWAGLAVTRRQSLVSRAHAWISIPPPERAELS